jgi:maleylacetate reductase
VIFEAGVHLFPQQEKFHYGRPAAEVLAEHTGTAVWRCFVVTSRSVRGTALMESILKSLGERVAGCCERVSAHSHIDDVLTGSETAPNASADVLIAVGGGSVIDAAKVMQRCMWHDIPTARDSRTIRVLAC